MRLITPWHVPTKSSDEAEVGQEGDEHARSTAATSPSRSCVSASATTLTPADRAAGSSPGRSRPPGAASRAGRTPGRPRRRRARRGRRPAARRPQLHRAVERDEVGAERVDEAAARSLGAGEQHAPVGRGNSRTRPSCVDTDGTRSGSCPRPRSASAVPGPIAATAGSAPAPARQQLRAVPARDDDPVVALHVDRLVAERLDLDQRAHDDLVAERLEAAGQLAGAPSAA